MSLLTSIRTRTNKKRSARSQQQGQALTEFVVLALSLIPLFLLMPLIAKYQDIGHSTQMAARYVAFDATIRNDVANWYKPTDQLRAEVGRRFFGTANAPIKTNDTAGNFDADRNAFWTNPQGGPLLPDFDTNVAVTYGFGQSSSVASAFSASRDGLPFALHPQLGLSAQGIYTANISVTLANLPDGLRFYEPFNKINLAMTRSTSIVFDPWMANDPKQAEERFGNPGMVPATGLIDTLSPVADTAVALVDPFTGVTPHLGDLTLWTDVVPKDRLHN